jgi:hypothetical protein
MTAEWLINIHILLEADELKALAAVLDRASFFDIGK